MSSRVVSARTARVRTGGAADPRHRIEPSQLVFAPTRRRATRAPQAVLAAVRHGTGLTDPCDFNPLFDQHDAGDDARQPGPAAAALVALTKRPARLRAHLAIFTIYRNYMRRRFNRDRPQQTPAVLLGLLPRQLHPSEVLAWRQDWGERSIHPMSTCASRTVREAIAMPA